MHIYIKLFRYRVRSHERRNKLIPVWDFKQAWKQVLFTWSFISAAFQNVPIFWWTYVCISFRAVFNWYFITRNEISFLSKWPIPALSFKRTCTSNAISNESALMNFFSGKLCSHKNLNPVRNFGQNNRYEIHTVLSFISPQFMWTQVKSWLNTEVRFSTEMKSHTGLSSFRLSCERTHKYILGDFINATNLFTGV